MAFLKLGGDASRPTYFEVYAAVKLVPSLKAALIYSLSVAGQSRSWVLRLLQYEDEVFALVSLALERHSLANLHATFAESLYGLKRQPVLQPQQQQQQQAASSSSSGAAAALAAAGLQQAPSEPPLLLNKQQQRQALLCQVLLPYIKAKMDSLYARHSQQRGGGGVLGLALSRRQQRHQQGAAASSTNSQSSTASQRLHALAARLQEASLSAFLLLYPYLHASIEGLKFVYQLGYLLDVFDTHSPVLQLLGQRLVRLTGPEMAQMERHKQQHRQQQLARAQQHSSSLWSVLHRAWLRGSSMATDHLRNALILSVFGFKILEWWYTSAEDKLTAGAALPPPPAPPAPCPNPGGVKLPADVSLCPLCRQQRVNPSTLAVSGYVFCYPCLFRHVSSQHCCPVTRAPATLDHIRKLYEAM